jgi:hypothetical protein
MRSRTDLSAVLTAAWLALGLASCAGAPPAPPPETKKQTPEDRVLLVGKTWQETVQTEAFPNEGEVSFVRSVEKVELRLKAGSRDAALGVEREELLRTSDGRQLHCRSEGSGRAAVRYLVRLGEAAVAVRAPRTALRRACKEGGFDHPPKPFEPFETLYVLRGDRLVSVEPAGARSVLLPMD